jgi:hypothetical protein
VPPSAVKIGYLPYLSFKDAINRSATSIVLSNDISNEIGFVCALVQYLPKAISIQSQL